MSPPDPGAAAAKTAAAAPDSDTGFGAMLSQLDGSAEISPAAAGNAVASGDDGNAITDAVAAALGAANQTPWMAQLDAAKILPEKQAPLAEADAPVADDLPQTGKPAIASQAQSPAPQAPAPQTTALQIPAPQIPAPQASVPVAASPLPSPVAAPQTPLPDDAADEPIGDTIVVTANADPEAAAVQDNSPEPAPVEPLEAPDRPKPQKPTHAAATEADQPEQPAAIALADLPSPVAAQFLAAPTAPAPQPTAAPDAQTNRAPTPEESIAAAQPVPEQARPAAPTVSDKSVNPKNAGIPDTKAAPEARSSAPRDSRAASANDSAPAPTGADANDTPDRIVGNAAAPAAHGAKSEPAAASQNLAEPAPAISAVPNHGALDIPAAVTSNAPPAPAQRSDLDVPVRLSFAAPNADVPSFDALALKIAARSADGDNNFSIRLDPPELGRIEVNLNVRSDGHARAELSADKPQTLELLQKDASSLERALKDAGINLAGGLAFSLKGEGKSQAWRDMQNGSRGRSLQIAAVDAANANADAAVAAALARNPYGLSTARLDIRV
jgi:flagellar hook-length control protein FliK